MCFPTKIIHINLHKIVRFQKIICLFFFNFGSSLSSGILCMVNSQLRRWLRCLLSNETYSISLSMSKVNNTR